ncbi:hypothetical protein SAMN04488074_109221 [Lentzea albidocapillata subsp. violacea]|uniref:PhnA protein n=1 Tax=Lentzea albidocapillata subsp. violacea TaxID=128104 RepID=A0A1G9HZT7_9PSEU|nr:hypothetical protein SAMN04488074_109221 [Lentzea albidocapillata subsp. violacea]
MQVTTSEPVTSAGDGHRVITCTSPTCEHPTDPEAYVCGVCLGRLDGDLADVADLAEELDTTIARQARTGMPVGSRSAEVGLPYNDGAAEVGRDLRSVLSTWVRDLWETHGPRRVVITADKTRATELDPLDLDDTLAEMAAWLRRHPSWIEYHPAGGELVDEIADAVERTRRAVDLAPARVYCGPCPDCGADLYARPDRETVRCRECETRHEVEALRAELLDAARGHLGTAAEIARALPKLLGRELSANSLRTWARSGKLTRRAPDAQGQPRYLVGEVIDVALATPTRSRVTRAESSCA